MHAVSTNQIADILDFNNNGQYLYCNCLTQGRRNGFQSGRAMAQWKALSATIVGRQEEFSNSRSSKMAKTIIFWPWWQTFNGFYFETFSFLTLSSFSLFATEKSGGTMPPGPPSVAGSVLTSLSHHKF